jgi:hypothetical protein
MAVTSHAARPWHAFTHQCSGAFYAKNEGETVTIDTLAMAFVALAVGLPAVIGATMLGSKL